MARKKQQAGRTTRLKTGDEVRVISGKHKGQSGTIRAVDRKKNRVFVENVNIIRKALRPTQENPQGGYREQEASIHASNVMILDPQTGDPTRIGMKFLDEGTKVTISHKTGAVLDQWA